MCVVSLCQLMLYCKWYSEFLQVVGGRTTDYTCPVNPLRRSSSCRRNHICQCINEIMPKICAMYFATQFLENNYSIYNSCFEQKFKPSLVVPSDNFPQWCEITSHLIGDVDALFCFIVAHNNFWLLHFFILSVFFTSANHTQIMLSGKHNNITPAFPFRNDNAILIFSTNYLISFQTSFNNIFWVSNSIFPQGSDKMRLILQRDVGQSHRCVIIVSCCCSSALQIFFCQI